MALCVFFFPGFILFGAYQLLSYVIDICRSMTVTKRSCMASPVFDRKEEATFSKLCQLISIYQVEINTKCWGICKLMRLSFVKIRATRGDESSLGRLGRRFKTVVAPPYSLQASRLGEAAAATALLRWPCLRPICRYSKHVDGAAVFRVMGGAGDESGLVGRPLVTTRFDV